MHNIPDFLRVTPEMQEHFAKGGMIKRADGSYSRRGLWDNIRANKGSGRKPTKEMLEQERKIRAKEYEVGGSITFSAGGEKHRVYEKESPTGNGKGVQGHIMVTHPTKDKGKWDTIDLTEKAGAHTVAEGVAATKEWHAEHPGYANGGYTVRRSNARKGKTHVVIGPDGTKKYFGDSKLGQHPNDPARKKAFYARHKHNLAHNPYFRAFARATWADGGEVSKYQSGGETFDYYTLPNGKKVRVEYVNEGASHYNPVTQTISFNQYDDPSNPEAVIQHEGMHVWQDEEGQMHINTPYSYGPLKRPNMVQDGSDEAQNYFNRRPLDEEYKTNQVLQTDPKFQFVPGDLLYNGHGSFPGVNELMYRDPNTVEGQARDYEYAFRRGEVKNPVIVKEYKNGGSYGPFYNRADAAKLQRWRTPTADSMTPSFAMGGLTKYQVKGFVDDPEGTSYMPETANSGQGINTTTPAASPAVTNINTSVATSQMSQTGQPIGVLAPENFYNFPKVSNSKNGNRPAKIPLPLDYYGNESSLPGEEIATNNQEYEDRMINQYGIKRSDIDKRYEELRKQFPNSTNEDVYSAINKEFADKAKANEVDRARKAEQGRMKSIAGTLHGIDKMGQATMAGLDLFSRMNPNSYQNAVLNKNRENANPMNTMNIVGNRKGIEYSAYGGYTGLKEGVELNLTTQQIHELEKQGYKFQIL